MSQKHEQAIVVLEVGELFKKLRGREDLNAKSPVGKWRKLPVTIVQWTVRAMATNGQSSGSGSGKTGIGEGETWEPY
jgi:hypothetical protein